MRIIKVSKSSSKYNQISLQYIDLDLRYVHPKIHLFEVLQDYTDCL